MVSTSPKQLIKEVDWSRGRRWRLVRHWSLRVSVECRTLTTASRLLSIVKLGNVILSCMLNRSSQASLSMRGCVMMKHCMLTGNGEIDFPEFLTMMAKKLEDVDTTEEIHEAFKGKTLLQPMKYTSLCTTVSVVMWWPVTYLWPKLSFVVFDLKNLGYITRAELKYIMMNRGEKMSEEEAEEMVCEFDKDNDGRIEYAGEWRHEVRRCRKRKPKRWSASSTKITTAGSSKQGSYVRLMTFRDCFRGCWRFVFFFFRGCWRLGRRLKEAGPEVNRTWGDRLRYLTAVLLQYCRTVSCVDCLAFSCRICHKCTTNITSCHNYLYLIFS